MRGTTKLCKKHSGFRRENNRQIHFPRYCQAGTIAISESGDQNSGRIGEDGRQDLQRFDVDVSPTQLQKDQPQRQRTDQNDGPIHILRPVRTNHWCKSITDRLCRGLQMPNDTVQKTDNGKETTRRTRQVEQRKRKVHQKPGRRCRNGRSYTVQENKDSNQVSNSGKTKTKTQKWRQERQIVRRLSKPSERIGRTGRVDKNLGG